MCYKVEGVKNDKKKRYVIDLGISYTKTEESQRLKNSFLIATPLLIVLVYLNLFYNTLSIKYKNFKKLLTLFDLANKKKGK